MPRIGVGLGLGLYQSRGIFASYASRVLADGGVTEAGGCVDAVSGLQLNASLLLIPSGYKSGKAYAQIPTNGNGDLTWTRASTALRTNSSSLLESMGSNVPRLSYMYGSCPALLLEPQRTNLALYSDQFDNASWVKLLSAVTANTTTSPDGTTNADTFYANVATTSSPAEIFHYTSQAVNTTYAYSVYAKKSTSNFIALRLTAASGNPYAWFNLNTGAVGTVQSGITASIQSVGDGWYRCVVVGTTASTIAVNRVDIVVSDNNGNFVCANNGSIFIYGAQLEAGAYPTTYIPTTTASATRVADSFSRNNIYTNGLITSSGGTWFVELRGNENRPITSEVVTAGLELGNSAGNATEAFKFRRGGGTSRVNFWKVVGGTTSQIYELITNTAKIAIKWNGTTADVFVNGTKVVSATSFTATTSLEFLRYIADQVPTFIQHRFRIPIAQPLPPYDLRKIPIPNPSRMANIPSPNIHNA